MRIDVMTLFPEMFTPLESSIMGKAQSGGQLDFNTYNFRDYAVNKHGHVDDAPYGGGAGMLLRMEPLVHQLEAIPQSDRARIILVDPAGRPFSQEMAQEWSKEDHLIFICGHYEGFDARIEKYVTDQVSIGDYVLTNGELPAMVMIDATVRLKPQVLGNGESIVDESYQSNRLEYPQYTRPLNFRGDQVPDVLLSGHHGKVEEWRHYAALKRTYDKRPDLLDEDQLCLADRELLAQIKAEENSQE